MKLVRTRFATASLGICFFATLLALSTPSEGGNPKISVAVGHAAIAATAVNNRLPDNLR